MHDALHLKNSWGVGRGTADPHDDFFGGGMIDLHDALHPEAQKPKALVPMLLNATQALALQWCICQSIQKHLVFYTGSSTNKDLSLWQIIADLPASRPLRAQLAVTLGSLEASRMLCAACCAGHASRAKLAETLAPAWAERAKLAVLTGKRACWKARHADETISTLF